MGKIVFLGDSITQALAVDPSVSFARQIGLAHNYPVADIVNAGINGNKTADMLARLQSDVLSYSPGVCVLMCMVNDVNHDVPLVTFSANVSSILDQLAAADIDCVVISPPLYRGGSERFLKYNPYLLELESLAVSRGLPFIDLFRRYAWEFLVDADYFATLYTDVIHQSAAGYDYISSHCNSDRYAGVFGEGVGVAPEPAIALRSDSPCRLMPSTRRIFAGSGAVHRHFGGIARTEEGTLHLMHRKASEHGSVGAGSIAYCTVPFGGGGAVSVETIIAAPGSGRDLRDCDIGLTQTGRLVAHWTDNPAAGTGVGPVYFKSCYSDDGGATWSAAATYDTISFDFARTYGAMKQIPGTARLVKPGYKQIGAGAYACCMYYSDDDGVTWYEGAPIYSGTAGAYNETGVVFIDSLTGFACTRANPPGLHWSVTRDGGLTWSPITGISWSTSSTVAPSLDILVVDGVVHILLGYVDRAINKTCWRWARADQLLTNAEAMKPHLKVTSAADMVNASGYQKPSLYPSGEMISVEYKEFDNGDKSSDVRLVYGNPANWIAGESGTFIPSLKGTSVAGSPTYLVRDGVFSKRGRMVTAHIRIDLSAKADIAGQIAIAGLPFTVAPGPVNRAAAQISFMTGHSMGSYNSILGFTLEGSKEIRINMLGSSGLASFQATNITDTFVIYLTVTYQTEE